MKECFELPVVALIGIVAFPGVEMLVDIKRDFSNEAVSAAMMGEKQVVFVTQKDNSKEDPVKDDLYGVGVLGKIKQVIKVAPNITRVFAKCIKRVRISSLYKDGDFYKADCVSLINSIYDFTDEIEKKAVSDLVKEAFEKYCLNSTKFNMEFVDELMRVNDFGLIMNVMGARIDFKIEDKQKLLETIPLKARAFELLRLFRSEISVLEVKKEIDSKVKANIEKAQRENILREQLKVITDELMDKDGLAGEIRDYKDRMAHLALPEEVEEKLNKELERLKKMPSMAAEGSVCRDYIETILSLPWGIYSKENKSLKRAESILERDHYGLKDVKERIVEFLALRLNTDSAKAPVLCLIGPPGVGKTSVAKSVANALGRKYIRMSLGGVHDEAELRGHRRTYIGAMPGRIIASIKNAGTSNPLILMDEIDKIGSDYKGDPASALLEVLDGEQNFSFRDNYLEVPYDVSKVFFICTANTADTIPPALRDRMEIIELNSYTAEEKLKIASKYLVKKQLKFHGLNKKQLKFKSGIIAEIIDGYTREAGVRNLERLIGSICRKALKEMLTTDKEEIVVDKAKLLEYLGKRKFKKEIAGKTDRIGEVTGLAWTQVGGTTLQIEVNTFSGSGKIKLTGNVGKVMEESAFAAYSYIRANAEKLGIFTDFSSTDVHIHIPEGATPKDGPSAGITMTTAMFSALGEIPVKHSVAMTGEVDIRGNVLPIGGLREKALAAKAAGIKTVILPMENSADLEELPDYAKSGMEFILVSHIDEVFKNALNKSGGGIKIQQEKIMPAISTEENRQEIRS